MQHAHRTFAEVAFVRIVEPDLRHERAHGHGCERAASTLAPCRVASRRHRGSAFASSNIASVVRCQRPSRPVARSPTRAPCVGTLCRRAPRSICHRVGVLRAAGAVRSHRHRAPRARDFSDFRPFRAAEVFHAIAIPNLKNAPAGGTIALVGVTATSRA